jgi:hypothetical protein
MDRLDLVRRQDLDGPERVGQPPPGELLQTRRGATGSATRTVERFICQRLGRILWLRHARMLRRAIPERRYDLRDAVARPNSPADPWPAWSSVRGATARRDPCLGRRRRRPSSLASRHSHRPSTVGSPICRNEMDRVGPWSARPAHRCAVDQPRLVEQQLVGPGRLAHDQEQGPPQQTSCLRQRLAVRVFPRSRSLHQRLPGCAFLVIHCVDVDAV